MNSNSTRQTAPGAEAFLSIVIPTYNEGQNITAFLEQLEDVLSEARIKYEIIVSDDNSPDGTGKIAKNYAEKRKTVRVCERVKKDGPARAVVAGWRIAKGNIIGTINGDFQHPPEVIPKLVRAIVRGADVAVASRHIKEGKITNWSFHRILASSAARWAGMLLLPRVFKRINDPMSGCFLVRAELVPVNNLAPIGFKSLIEVVARSPIETITEIPYEFRSRQFGKSKVRISDTFKYFAHLLKLASCKPAPCIYTKLVIHQG